MVGHEYVPDRGDIVWLDFTPQVEHEQAGRRPAFVISTREYSERSRLSVFRPITSTPKGLPFEVLLPPTGSISGAVLVDHIKSLDWRARHVRFVTNAKPRTLAEVFGKLGALVFPTPSLRDGAT